MSAEGCSVILTGPAVVASSEGDGGGEVERSGEGVDGGVKMCSSSREAAEGGVNIFSEGVRGGGSVLPFFEIFFVILVVSAQLFV
jgi:hypothetical protein